MATKRMGWTTILPIVFVVVGVAGWAGLRYATREAERRVKVALGSFSGYVRLDYRKVRLGLLPPRVRVLGLTAQPLGLPDAVRAEEVVVRDFDTAHDPPHALRVDAKRVTLPESLVRELRPDDTSEVPWSKVFPAVSAADVGLRYVFDEAQRTLQVEEAYLDVPDAARVAVSVRLANVTVPSSLFERAEALGAMLLESVRFSAVDRGAVPRLIAERVMATATPIATVIGLWAQDDGGGISTDLAQLDPASAAAVRSFLRAPGSLEIVVAPKVPLRLGGFAAAAFAGTGPDWGSVTARSTPGGDLTRRVADATATLVAGSLAVVLDQARQGDRWAAFELADRLHAANLAAPELDRSVAGMKEQFERRATVTRIHRGEESQGCKLDAAGALTCGTAAPSEPPISGHGTRSSGGLTGLSSVRVSFASPDGKRFFVATFSSDADAKATAGEDPERFEQLFLYDAAEGLRPIESTARSGPTRFLDWTPDGSYGIAVNASDGDTWYDVVAADTARVFTVRPSSAPGGCRSAQDDGLYGCTADPLLDGAVSVSVDELVSGWTRAQGDWAWRARARAAFCPARDAACEESGIGATTRPASVLFDVSRRSLSVTAAG